MGFTQGAYFVANKIWYYSVNHGKAQGHMPNKLTIKGQVTIPKQIREALGLKPGMPVDFALNYQGEAVIRRAKVSAKSNPDRFEAARGTADVKWHTNGLTII